MVLRAADDEGVEDEDEEGSARSGVGKSRSSGRDSGRDSGRGKGRGDGKPKKQATAGMFVLLLLGCARVGLLVILFVLATVCTMVYLCLLCYPAVLCL